MSATKCKIISTLTFLAVLGLTSSLWAQDTFYTGTLAIGQQFCGAPVQATQPGTQIEIAGSATHTKNGNPAPGTIWSIWEGPSPATVQTTRVFHVRNANVGQLQTPPFFGPAVDLPVGEWAVTCVDADTESSISYVLDTIFLP